MQRREFLAAVAAGAIAARFGTSARAADVASSKLTDLLAGGSSRVVLKDQSDAPAETVHVDRKRTGNRFRSTLTNISKQPLAIREVVLFDVHHQLNPDTAIYAEGFTMLSQTAGTLEKPVDLAYPDRKHYKIPEPEGLRTAYGMMMIGTGPGRTLLGFTSCAKFVGRFGFDGTRLRISIDTENLQLNPGQTWELEEILIESGEGREKLLAELAASIEAHHPRLRHDPPPAGWCSWYWFGARVKAEDITANLDWIAKNVPQMKYIQIDDGYQPIMGDWLETGKAFGGDVRGVLRQIREKGFEPAIWVAPFIASESSHVFQQHPDWFVKDETGKPMRSDRMGFGGWRQGPWYCLDGTHPEARRHLENLFHTMRNEWGCTYFKLDANYWGAIHGGVHHDAAATRVQAYRRGMEAVLKGAGDSFILGCNHPIWPSLGVIHGSRSSGDINRSWATVSSTARQNLLRGWQNGKLWWNDPDCVVLVDKAAGGRRNAAALTEAEYLFHATAVYASGGLILDGDDLPKITAPRRAMLEKLLPPAAVAAQFDDEKLEVGVTRLQNRLMYCVFNWAEAPADRFISLAKPTRFKNYWTGEDLGVHEGQFKIATLAAHSAMLVEATPA
ncbi:MAG TPA: glycoside hydrolase family 36 protein [Tepidisphaeraceae bacterium]